VSQRTKTDTPRKRSAAKPKLPVALERIQGEH
jgi:hypothetical protein